MDNHFNAVSDEPLEKQFEGFVEKLVNCADIEYMNND